MKIKIREIRLTEKAEAALLALAEKHNALAYCGADAGKPSWRVLIAKIADGTIPVGSQVASDRRNKNNKKKKTFRLHAEYPKGWWKPGPNDDMPVAAVLEATGLTVEQVSAAGLLLVDDGKHFMAPSEWVKWCRDLDEEPKEPPATKAKAEPKDDDSASIEKMLGETN